MKLKPLLLLTLTAIATGCGDPSSSGNSLRPGSLALNLPTPSLAQFAPSLVLTQAKIQVSRVFPSQEFSEPLDSTTIRFADDQESRSARLNLQVAVGDTIGIQVDYLAGDGTLLFQGFGQSIVGAGGIIASPALQPFYVGPGSNIAFISLSPFDSTMQGGDAVTFDPSPIDSSQAPVTQFYLSWATDDARVPIDARGNLSAPTGLTKRVTVTATSPNGTVGTTVIDIVGPEPLGIIPDSIEMLPSGEQFFRVTVGAQRSSQFVWSVNGVDGGNATFGTINVDGFYQAPATTPSPAKFKVCARDATANIPTSGCALVTIRAVPSVGADIVVINDQNIFDGYAMSPDSSAGNRRFVRNLVSFQGSGPRASAKVVMYDRSRNSPCLLNGECSDTANAQIDAVIKAAGYTISKVDFASSLTGVPPDVKVLFLWMPTTFFQPAEVSALKRFAAEGGRIVFVGERIGFYTQTGIDVENSLLAQLGSQAVNLANEFDCLAYFGTPPGTLPNNPLFSGVTRLLYACASEIDAGPNDAPLFYDQTGTHLLAAITKVNLTQVVGSSRMTVPSFDGSMTSFNRTARGLGGNRQD